MSLRSTTIPSSISSGDQQQQADFSQYATSVHGVSIAAGQPFYIAALTEILALLAIRSPHADEYPVKNTDRVKWRIKNIQSRIQSRTNTYVCLLSTVLSPHSRCSHRSFDTSSGECDQPCPCIFSAVTTSGTGGSRRRYGRKCLGCTLYASTVDVLLFVFFVCLIRPIDRPSFRRITSPNRYSSDA